MTNPASSSVPGYPDPDTMGDINLLLSRTDIPTNPFNRIPRLNDAGQITTPSGDVVGDVESALQRYGAVLNGTADDTAALQETIDWFAATYPRSVLRFPNMVNQRARLTGELVVDMAKTAIDFSQLAILVVDARVQCVDLWIALFPIACGGAHADFAPPGQTVPPRRVFLELGCRLVR